MRGIRALKAFGFTYDILIFPDQLKFIPEFVASCPDQKFVIDHIAKPYIKDKKIDEWSKDIKAVAAYENVWCKISGMGEDEGMSRFVPVGELFAGRHFDAEIVLLCVRWYLSFKLSYRDLVSMMSERGRWPAQ